MSLTISLATSKTEGFIDYIVKELMLSRAFRKLVFFPYVLVQAIFRLIESLAISYKVNVRMIRFLHHQGHNFFLALETVSNAGLFL